MGGGGLPMQQQRGFSYNGTSWIWFCILLFVAPFLVTCNQLALLAGTFKTFQKHACDDSTLEISCPANTSIDILHANYGVSMRPKLAPCPLLQPMKDSSVPCELPPTVGHKAFQFVLDLCHTRRHCRIEVKPPTFADQDLCPLTPKYIEVAYKCRPYKFINKIICEGETLSLSCRNDSKIAIYSILFGRSGKGELQCPQPLGVPEGSCGASFATESVMRLCHGLSECHVQASTAFFGRPCPSNYALYMKAVYTCVPQTVLKPPDMMGTARGTDEEIKIPNIVSDSEAKKKRNKTKLRERHKISPKNATSPRRQESFSKDLIINCTVTILSGSDQTTQVEIATEWMKAIAFFNRNYEKIILYIVIGACLAAMLCLMAVSIHLWKERRKDRHLRKFILPEQLSSIMTDGDRLDEGDLTVPTCSSSSDNYSPTPPYLRDQEVVRYYTGPHSKPRHNDNDLILPRSLSRENNHHLYN